MSSIGWWMRAFAAVFAALLLAAGCSSSGKPVVDTAAVDQFVATGYRAPRHFSVRTEAIEWSTPDITVVSTLTWPQATGPFPLVIYLPGLGQSASTASAWTRAWAEAGYAVLSTQPLDDDASAWSSALAHSGDFSTVARRRFAPAVLARRLARLGAELDGIRRGASQPGAAAIDWSRVALAGFDLGAYTAMAAAGEAIPGLAPIRLPIDTRAVIALSPFQDADAAARPDRFATVAAPVLWVSGRNDIDGYGLSAEPLARRSAFDALAGPARFLLWLTDGSHRQVGGELVAEPTIDAPPRQPTHQRRQSAADEADEEAFLFRGESATTGTSRAAWVSGSSQLMTQRAIGLATVRAVTIAFLDAYLRDEAPAREWLQGQAPHWVEPGAMLRVP
jgi:dienelactone hydrolase